MDRYNDYPLEMAKFLAFIERALLTIVRNGFGGMYVECRLGSGKRREVVVTSGPSEKFRIDESEVTK